MGRYGKRLCLALLFVLLLDVFSPVVKQAFRIDVPSVKMAKANEDSDVFGTTNNWGNVHWRYGPPPSDWQKFWDNIEKWLTHENTPAEHAEELRTSRGAFSQGSNMAVNVPSARVIYPEPPADTAPDDTASVSTYMVAPLLSSGNYTFPLDLIRYANATRNLNIYKLDQYNQANIGTEDLLDYDPFSINTLRRFIEDVIQKPDVYIKPYTANASEASQILKGCMIYDTILKGFEASTPVALLNNGFSLEMGSFLLSVGVPFAVVDMDNLNLIFEHSILIIPSGGLYGSTSPDFSQTLKTFVEGGGTLIVMSQPTGEDFQSIPTPNNEKIQGYGWTEDQQCVSGSVSMASYDSLFSRVAGLSLLNDGDCILDLCVDGFFTKLPSSAKVLLLRQENSMPAMFTYALGQGRVLVTSWYGDYAYAAEQISDDEKLLVRDMVDWAQSKSIPGFSSASSFDSSTFQDVTLTIPVINQGKNPSTQVQFILYNPDGEAKIQKTTSLNIAAGQTSSTLFTFSPKEWQSADLTPTDVMGIWNMDINLLDAAGQTISTQYYASYFSLSTINSSPGGYTVSGAPVSFSITTPGITWLSGTNVLFTFHVWNRLPTVQSLRVTWGYYHSDNDFTKNITVPANSEFTFVDNHRIDESSGQALAILYNSTSTGEAVWLASANRGFYEEPTPFAIDVQTDCYWYGPNDVVNISVTLANQTDASFKQTSLFLSVSGALPASVFNKTIPLDLSSGAASYTSSFVIPNVTISPSSDEVYLSAELRDPSNNSIIGFGDTTFNLQDMANNSQPISGGGFQIVSTPPENATFTSGEAASFTYQLINPDSNEASTVADFEIPGIYRNETILTVQGNSTATITYKPTMPVDQPSGECSATLTVMGDSAETIFNVKSVEVNAYATLNKKLYESSDTAHLVMNVTNISSVVGQSLRVKVNYGSFSAEQRLTLGAYTSTKVSFDVPVSGSSSPLLFYGVYNQYGRSLSLNTLYINKRQGPLAVSTDKQLYSQGDAVKVEIKNLNSTAVSANITVPGHFAKLVLSPSESRVLQFNLPRNFTSGTYAVIYSTLIKGEIKEYNYFFDVKGVEAHIIDLSLQKDEYYPSEEFEASATVKLNTNINGTVELYQVDSSGSEVRLSRENVTLLEGDNTIDIDSTLNASSPGTSILIFDIYAGNLNVPICETSRSISIIGDSIVDVSTDRTDYGFNETIQAEVDISGTIPGQLRFVLNGTTVATQVFNPDPSGYTVLDLPVIAGNKEGSVLLTTTLTANGQSDSFSTTLNIQEASSSPKPLFEANNLVINPSQVELSKAVTISIDLLNNGDASGTYNVVLKINGAQEDSRDVTLTEQNSTTVSFTVVENSIGTYMVDVNGLTGSFEVSEKTGSLRILVKDNNGNPVSSASVTSTKQPTGQATLTGTTNNSGYSEFNNIKLGSYVFTATKSGYDSNTASGSVEEDKTTEISITIKSSQSAIPGYPSESITLGIISTITVIYILKKKLLLIHHVRGKQMKS